MKWKIGHLIRKSEREIRGAGCKEIVRNERQLCAPLCLHLDLVASNHESSFCDVTAYWPLEGPRTKSGVYSNTQGAASVSLPPVQRRGQPSLTATGIWKWQRDGRSLWLLSSRRNNRGTETVFNVSISHSGCRRSHVPELQINVASMGVQSNTKQSPELWGNVSLVRIKVSVRSVLCFSTSLLFRGWSLSIMYSREEWLRAVLFWIICAVRQASLRISRLNIAGQIVEKKIWIKCKLTALTCNICLSLQRLV